MADAWDLTPSEVAAQVGVHKDTVNAWADKGKIPCWRTPTGYRRFRQSDVDKLLETAR